MDQMQPPQPQIAGNALSSIGWHLPTLGVGKIVLYSDGSIVHVYKHNSGSPLYDEGAFIILVFHQMSAEEGGFLLQSSSVPCKQGVKSASLHIKPEASFSPIIKSSSSA